MKKRFLNHINGYLTYILLKFFNLLKILQTRSNYEIRIFDYTIVLEETTPLAFLLVVIFGLLFITIFTICLYNTLNTNILYIV